MQNLKMGIALGSDSLNAEHLRYAHPTIAVHMCTLFHSIILHGYVPKDFGSGIVIPLIKNRTGDVNNANNYRDITLIPAISKLFLLVLIEICEQSLSCDELQFGFKKGVGCSEAIFALRSTIDYLKDRGSSISVAALDISKAFDTVNHYKLYESLINLGIPKWILNDIINWYCKLSVVVRWKTALSNIVYVSSDVRQGSSLSPALFTLFANMFIVKMRELNAGCCVNGTFVGCRMYADDLVVLSASVSGLRSLLDCCYHVSITLTLKFNCLKSSCSVFGSASKLNISKMQLGSVSIERTSSLFDISCRQLYRTHISASDS